MHTVVHGAICSRVLLTYIVAAALLSEQIAAVICREHCPAFDLTLPLCAVMFYHVLMGYTLSRIEN
jgi:hypothetical protein